MSSITIVSAILSLVAGIGIFLIACQIMSENLESASSKRLKNLFSKASKNNLIGVGIGTVGTAAIQSSGAITVMVIGFVNAGIMSLRQAATIIYGANIGTTITAQIVALGMFGNGGLSTTVIFAAFAGIGAFTSLFAKNNIVKQIGGILTGFGMLFVGLEMMSGSMADFAGHDAVKQFLSGIDNAILLVLIGAVLTAVIQSSSVMTSIAIAMVYTNLISLDQGIFLTMGSNIGSCVVALIAGMTSGKNAKRTALIHLFFNCSGVVIFLLAGWIVSLVTGGVTFGDIFAKMFPDAPQTQLAMFHTIFNVTTVVIILPLTNALVNLVTKIIPYNENEHREDGNHLYFLDENMLKTPPVAVQQTKNEVVNMAAIAMRNFNASLDVVTTLDFSNIDTFRKNENELNYLNMAIIEFVVKLSGKPLSKEDRLYVSTIYRSVRDLERIGDYAENIIEYADLLQKKNEGFSAEAKNEIANVRMLVNSLYEKVMEAYTKESEQALTEANDIEESIDEFTAMMEENHIKRLSANICTPDVGAQYLSLSSNVERIGDHLINVAKTIKSL